MQVPSHTQHQHNRHRVGIVRKRNFHCLQFGERRGGSVILFDFSDDLKECNFKKKQTSTSHYQAHLIIIKSFIVSSWWTGNPPYMTGFTLRILQPPSLPFADKTKLLMNFTLFIQLGKYKVLHVCQILKSMSFIIC